MMEQDFESFNRFGGAKDAVWRKKLADQISALLKGNSEAGLATLLQHAGIYSEGLKEMLTHPDITGLSRQDVSIAYKFTGEILEYIRKVWRQGQIAVAELEEEKQALAGFRGISPSELKSVWPAAVAWVSQPVYMGSGMDVAFYAEEFRKSQALKGDKVHVQFAAVREHFADAWETLLKRRQLDMELMAIEANRAEMCAELFRRAAVLKELQQALEPLMGEMGRLWDMSAGKWIKYDLHILTQFAEKLRSNPSLMKLAEMLGRMAAAEKEMEAERIRVMLPVREWKVEHMGKGELTGIRESDELSSALPSELALLGDEDLYNLFLLKFSEKRLLSFDFKTRTQVIREQEAEEVRLKAKPEKKGPVIICVDTSGSMHDAPETIAKTLSLALVRTALREKRKCYLISFSAEIMVLELTSMQDSLEAYIDFLSMSFHGGTDPLPALAHALKMLQTPGFAKADVLMVSDFVFPDFSIPMQQSIQRATEEGTRFHSLLIGSDGNEKALHHFRHQWKYDPGDPQAMDSLVYNLSTL